MEGEGLSPMHANRSDNSSPDVENTKLPIVRSIALNRGMIWPITAIAFILFGVIEIVLEYARDRLPDAKISRWQIAIGSLLIVAGIVLLAVSAKLAEKLADDFEE